MLKFSTKHCPKKMQTVLLSSVVLFGAILRFWNLGHWSFWIDEVFTVRDAENLSFDSWQVIPNPIPYLAVKLSIAVAGSSEWGSRFIPCIVGIVSIPAVFGLGRTLFNWRIGILSSAFVACSSWHLFWAQNARYPVFTFFFAVLTAWFFLHIPRTRFNTFNHRRARLLSLLNSFTYPCRCDRSGFSDIRSDLPIRKTPTESGG